MASSSSLGERGNPILVEEGATTQPVFMQLTWNTFLADVLTEIAPSLGDGVKLNTLKRFGSEDCFGYEIDNAELTEDERRMLEWAKGRFSYLIRGLKDFPTAGRVGPVRNADSDIETLLWGSAACFIHNVFVPPAKQEHTLAMVEQIAQLIPKIHPWRGKATKDTVRGKELLLIHKRIIVFFIEGIRFLRSTIGPGERESERSWREIQKTFAEDMEDLRHHIDLYECGEEPVQVVSESPEPPAYMQGYSVFPARRE